LYMSNHISQATGEIKMNNEQSHKVNLSDAEIDALYMLVKNEAKLAEAPANIKF